MATAARWGLLTVLLLQLWSLGSCKWEKDVANSFCTNALSRPSCPDLATFDKIQIASYGGRWFEIGATANTKNLRENGGVCVLADYSILQPPSPGKGAVVGVRNSIYSLGKPYNRSIAFISITAGQVCSQARNICSQVLVSTFAKAVAQIDDVRANIQKNYVLEDKTLEEAKTSISYQLEKISRLLNFVATIVRRLQIINSRISQGEGDLAANVESLLKAVSTVNKTATEVSHALTAIRKQGNEVARVAEALSNATKGGLATQAAAELRSAVQLLETGDKAVEQEVADIQGLLSRVAGASAAFRTPTYGGKKGYLGISATASQNASFAGKLDVTFPGFGNGQYWVLALEGSASEGYDASLVYGCSQAQVGIQETLFVLSRTPTLPHAVVERLLDRAEALGVRLDCNNPFVFTVQSDECVNRPPVIAMH